MGFGGLEARGLKGLIRVEVPGFVSCMGLRKEVYRGSSGFIFMI